MAREEEEKEEQQQQQEQEEEEYKTKLVTFQMYTNLIPKFDKQVNEQFGQYKKSKVLNALIEGYLSGKYRITSFY